MPKELNEVPTQSYLPAKIRSQKQVKVPHLRKIYCFVTKQPAGWHLETCLRLKNTLLLQHVSLANRRIALFKWKNSVKEVFFDLAKNALLNRIDDEL